MIVFISNVIFLIIETLYKQLYLHIFLNFEIWTNAPFDVQEQLLTYISEYAVARESQVYGTDFRSLFSSVEHESAIYGGEVGRNRRQVLFSVDFVEKESHLPDASATEEMSLPIAIRY